jgi:N-acetylneuraminate epimerase
LSRSKRVRNLLAVTLALSLFHSACGDWKTLTPLPDKEGCAGSFAGVSNGALIVAGGSNFKDKRPWDGGIKTWYDTVYVLRRPDGKWIAAGKLPRPVGYGVSVTFDNGLVCVGGSDKDRHYADAFRLIWKDGKVVIAELPPLPEPIANASGAMVGNVLYVAGGLAKPNATNTMKTAWAIDLSSAMPIWTQIESCPGSGRMLAAATSIDGAFWLMGGVDLTVGEDNHVERRYLKDAYRYDNLKGWKRIADLPHPIAAAPSPAPADTASFYVLGGDDGSQVKAAPSEHRGFSSAILRYDLMNDKWSQVDSVTAPRVTVPCVHWNTSYIVPGGEMRPGVRSPEVWSWTRGK